MLSSLKLDYSPKNKVEEHSSNLIRDLLVANSTETAENEAKRAYTDISDHFTQDIHTLLHDNKILKKAVNVLNART
jgi:hypothetical protein